MYRFHLDGKIACKLDKERTFQTLLYVYDILWDMEDSKVSAFEKTMDILELISNEGKLVLVLCHFAQVKLDHLEDLLYNLDL